MPVRVGPDRLRSGGLPENERSAPVRGRPVLESSVELRRSAPVDRRSVAGRADAGRSVDGRAADGRADEPRRSGPVDGLAVDDRSVGRLLIFWSLLSPVP